MFLNGRGKESEGGMMDTSGQYIKMSVKAIKIQEEWDRRKGDWYADPFWNNEKQKDDWNIYVLESDNQYLYQPRFIWLPRQDQLQGMVKDGLAWLHVRFDEFVRSRKGEWLSGEIQDYDSFEQLWFAFTMKEKFGKVWDGKEWTKEG